VQWLMIKCPVTGKPVAISGEVTEQAAADRADSILRTGKTGECTQCGAASHPYTHADIIAGPVEWNYES